MDQKKCTKCNTNLPLIKFRCKLRKNKEYYENVCKCCSYLRNKHKMQNYKIENVVKYDEIMLKKKHTDKTRYDKKRILIRKQQRKQFRLNNKERVKKWRNASITSKSGKVCMALRKRTRTEIGSGKEWLNLLNCSLDNLKKWFEFNFEQDKDYGFTWENYGKKWSIDHVVPCKSFDLTKPEQTRKCFTWMNIMPVDKKYNSTKNDKIVHSDIIKLNERLMKFQSLIDNDIIQNYHNINQDYLELVGKNVLKLDNSQPNTL